MELRGARRLGQFRLGAPRRLGLNQVALGAILILYAGWGIVGVFRSAGPYEEYIAPGGPMAEVLGPIDHLHRVAVVLFYTAVICFSLLVQGAMAAYYFSRRRHLLAYVNRTPMWILEMIRAASG